MEGVVGGEAANDFGVQGLLEFADLLGVLRVLHLVSAFLRRFSRLVERIYCWSKHCFPTVDQELLASGLAFHGLENLQTALLLQVLASWNRFRVTVFRRLLY